MKLMRYFHTVRYLKPIQVYGRVLSHLPRINVAPTAARPRVRGGQWREPALRCSSMTGPATFRFLNTELEIEGRDAWNRPGVPKLWLYNLHYFDDLIAEGRENRSEWHRELIRTWVIANPPGMGNGWEPYTLSRRIVNWIKWGLSGGALAAEAVASLAHQAAYLSRRIEWHLLANHVMVNAKALLFAGAFFDGPEADDWRREALTILGEQLPEQILADGGHFERSPMYHSLALEDVLDLINLAGTYPSVIPEQVARAWKETAGRMVLWLRTMCHPDGEISFFNDSATGVAPRPDRLVEYASRLGVPSEWESRPGLLTLPESGYVRLEHGETVCILDAGPIGPDYQPGHAHCDSLSFELSHRGRRVSVNSGTSTYEAGEERHRQRGTRAHNTVCVDGAEQSEIWAVFRVARRARPLEVGATRENGCLTVGAAHDGYLRLPRPVLHRRQVRLSAGRLEIEDRLEGSGRHTVEFLFHLHPGISVAPASEAFELCGSGGEPVARMVVDPRASWSEQPDTYHPEFGLTQPSRMLRGEWRGEVPVSIRTIIELS